MNQEARISALEYLVAELLKQLRDRDGKPIDSLIETTKSTILGSNGPGNPETKSAAVNALEDLVHLL